jgi:2-iminoacetate synthase ThiH
MNPDFELDIQHLQQLTHAHDAPSLSQVDGLLSDAARRPLHDHEINLLINAMGSPDFPMIRSWVLEAAHSLRRQLYGPDTVVMAPIEVSNRCASDCFFCGWRASNREMTRVSLPRDLILAQAEYLIRKGIHHIELVSGDDIAFVRDELPILIPLIRQLFPRGVRGTIWTCTLAMTAAQYEALAAAGADGIVVWQETYDRALYRRHITRGPKAFGVDDQYRVTTGGDGFTFRLAPQDRALRAGLQVTVGSMLGLNPDLNFEMLATLAHARHLMRHPSVTEDRPLVIGMPLWNNITTPATDNRPAAAVSIEPYFSYIAALYFLGLEKRKAWIFPNCRVSLPTQIEAVAACGVFTSTEVKVGPGGYLPNALKGMDPAQQLRVHEALRLMLKERYQPDMDLARFFDDVEQFRHHYHLHEEYLEAFQRHDLRAV